jgi:tRNA(Ile)-lysidine synthase TilS/MesJ
MCVIGLDSLKVTMDTSVSKIDADLSVVVLGAFRAVAHIPEETKPLTVSRAGVALSGGPDSIALLYLLRSFAQRPGADGQARQIFAVTVDHALRDESKEEAERTAAYARSLGPFHLLLAHESLAHSGSSLTGIVHTTMRVDWSTPPFLPKPPPHSSETLARLARLTLFRRFSRANGLRHIFLAHHADDQIEGLLIRQARRANALGLGGMRPCATMPPGWEEEEPTPSRDDHVSVVRPLLSVSKDRLLATCASYKLPYVVDPTNLDADHTPRNSFRQQLAAYPAPENGGPRACLLATASRLARRRDALELRLDHLLDPAHGLVDCCSSAAAAVVVHPHRLPPSTPPEIRRLLLARVVSLVSPRSSQQRADVSPRMLDTLSRAVFGPLTAAPVPRHPPRPSITPGGGVIWRPNWIEGRWRWIVESQPPRNKRNKDVRSLEIARR